MGKREGLADEVAKLEALCSRVHWHPCPECYEDEVCVEQCSTELNGADVPQGAAILCGNCAREHLRGLKSAAGEKGEHGWLETAAQESRNKDYYRGLVVEIGGLFGVNARTADDGTVQDDVLCAKVPELVRRSIVTFAAVRRQHAETIAQRLQTLHDDAGGMSGTFEVVAELIRHEYVKP